MLILPKTVTAPYIVNHSVDFCRMPEFRVFFSPLLQRLEARRGAVSSISRHSKRH